MPKVQDNKKNSEQDLLTLVQSLSRKERTSLKEDFSKKKGAKYLQLLDWILKRGNYSREEYLKSSKITLNHLRGYEKSLIDLICKMLRTKHREKSILTTLSDMIAEADILKRRGHYNLALKKLNEAATQAKKYDKLFILVEIIPLKSEVLLYLRQKNRQTEVEENYAQLHEVIQNLQQEATFRHHNVHWVLLSQTVKQLHEIPKTSLQSFDALVAKGFPQKGTFYAQYYFHSMQAIHAKIHRNTTAARAFQEQVVQLWEESAYEKIKNHNIKRYITQLANLINYAIADQKYDLAQDTINKIKQLKINDADGESEQRQDVLYGQQMLYMNSGNFPKAHELIPEIDTAIQEHSAQINPSRKYSFNYNNLITCFILGKYNEAHHWLAELQSVINLKKYEPRKDAQQFLRVLQLAIFYHTNSIIFANSIIRSIERKDVPDPIIVGLSHFEEKLFRFVKSLIKTPRNKQQTRAFFQEFKETLAKMPWNDHGFGYEIVKLWVEQNLNH